MYTISELSKKSNASADVVRFYARIGLIQHAAKQENGYRLFSSKDANRLRFIHIAKHLGFTLKEIKQITQNADIKVTPCEDVRKIIQNRILENRIKIDELTKLQIRMESALDQWKLMPDGTPGGNHVCHLIESIDNLGDKETSKSHKTQ